MIKGNSFVSAYVRIPTTLTAEVHLEGQFVVEKQTLDIERSLILRAGT
jgi:hypothetical protein